MTARRVMLLSTWLLATTAAAGDHRRDVRFATVPVPARVWAPADEAGDWPAAGAKVEAAALSCEAKGEGGGPPVVCTPRTLADELRASPLHLARCFDFVPVKLTAAEVRTYAKEARFRREGVALFVREVSHTSEPVYGRCNNQRIDGCMSRAAYPVVGHKRVELVNHVAVTASERLPPGAVEPVSTSVPWLRLEKGAWPEPPTEDTPADVAALEALAAASQPAATRFAALFDLVVARLLAKDAAGAAEALTRAEAMAPELTGTRFAAPGRYVATLADAEAIANGPGSPAERHARLLALLGAARFPVEQQRPVALLASRLRDALTPAVADASLFFDGSEVLTAVPRLLGRLHQLAHWRWVDPCAR